MNNNIMGCTSSVYAAAASSGKRNVQKKNKKKHNIPEVSVCVPSLWIPVQSHMLHPTLRLRLRGYIPQDLVHRITSLRNRITLLAESAGTSTTELTQALEEYLPLALGLANTEVGGVQDLVEFRWKEIEKGKQEICIANSWFEVLNVLYMMATVTLMDANMKLIASPKSSSSSSHSERLVSADCMRDALDSLLKAAGYLNFCVHHILLRLPPEIMGKLPPDLSKGVLEAISHQALAQGTEIQLGLAVKSQNATLSVKRRLACEQLSYFEQAHGCLSEVDNEQGGGTKKLSLFLKWKHLEAKAAAYYYHGLILDKAGGDKDEGGGDSSSPSSSSSGGGGSNWHEIALLCFLAAEELLGDGKKACLSFCLSDPITRSPPPWGAIKHLYKKIPDTASKKSQMYAYLLHQPHKQQQQVVLPDLPEFQLSLKADEFELPEVDPADWQVPLPAGMTL
ncbi:uncharacterized protein LOC127258240 [Andrographis paniculata]|uniref:uncharacterized protein LOC127258240 n=1 Tax=Andrographis paniculata TaxID=175694 RepID=UPI0021E7B666|nr:uncharacterized protein LOC127258240 [Andrographis paniculata]